MATLEMKGLGGTYTTTTDYFEVVQGFYATTTDQKLADLINVRVYGAIPSRGITDGVEYYDYSRTELLMVLCTFDGRLLEA
jgi:hypothetical protein